MADDLYLIAHHEVTGRPYLALRVLGIGLAGGLLAELMAADRATATLHRGYVVLTRDGMNGLIAQYVRPAEPVAQHVLDRIMSEPRARPAREWLLFLGQSAEAEVEGRLQIAGYLDVPASRVPWRTPRPVPGDRDWAYCALQRALGALDLAKRPEFYAALLAGLAVRGASGCVPAR